ncbi:hypothetical protein IMSHALPRED_004942 [Imshaugia aleurites]|uniref:Uncharacterized protein n=1 Tax=Imshaugia aleurites TaxID=172621 RepID=A0A8H3FBF1_9LECA|nr:hypothetical protein IMSHALPRED_004942 [Imshaugia aleurites]
MALVTATEEPTLRRSSRLLQKIVPSGTVDSFTKKYFSSYRRSRKVSQPKIPTFHCFLKLPRELRDMIYTILISTGHLSILQTCREVNLEAQSMFYRAAIRRQGAGYAEWDGGFYNIFSKLLVQNFELHCNLDSHYVGATRCAMQTSRGNHVDFQHASDFGRSNVRRNRMIIELKFGDDDSLRDAEHALVQYFDRPESFVGFRLLVVKFLPMPEEWPSTSRHRIRQMVKDILEPGLGSAVQTEEEGYDGYHMEFHPWDHAGRQSYRLESVAFLKRSNWDAKGLDEEESDF